MVLDALESVCSGLNLCYALADQKKLVSAGKEEEKQLFLLMITIYILSQSISSMIEYKKRENTY